MINQAQATKEGQNSQPDLLHSEIIKEPQIIETNRLVDISGKDNVKLAMIGNHE